MPLDELAIKMSRTAESENDPSNRTYEIIMVSIAGCIMLLSLIYIALAIVRRRWDVCVFSYDECTENTMASTATLTRNAFDNISIKDVSGPAHISYISEKEASVSEIPIGRVKLSRDALLYISLITCLNLPDYIDSEESL